MDSEPPGTASCPSSPIAEVSIQMADEEFVSRSLRRCALFAHVEAEGLSVLARAMVTRRFRRNEAIFHQGDPGDSLHVLASGAVKIVLPSSEGDEAIIATLTPGDSSGELARRAAAPHPATVPAVEPVETLSLARAPFQQLLDQDRGLRMALLSG